MSKAETPFSKDRLRELASYREVEAITNELKSINSFKVDADDPASLQKRLDDLGRKSQLDILGAHHAFRLDIVKEGEAFLPLLSRLSLLAGFDPVRIAQQDAAHQAETARLTALYDPHQIRLELAAASSGLGPSVDPASPLNDAERIEAEMFDVRAKLRREQRVLIGMETHDRYFMGHAPDADVFRADEPRLAEDDGQVTIDYEIPTRLHGVVGIIEEEVTKEASKRKFNPEEYGDLFTVEAGMVVAHPVLGQMVNALSTRRSYGGSFSPDIGTRAIQNGQYHFRRTHRLNRPPLAYLPVDALPLPSVTRLRNRRRSRDDDQWT